MLEEPVAALVLVPKERIGLRELEGLELELLHDAEAHGVEAREHPAATRALLVADVALGELHVEGGRGERHGLRVTGGLAHAHTRHGVARDGVASAIGEARMRAAQISWGQGTGIHGETLLTWVE